MPLPSPDLDYTLDGLKHRKWEWPAYHHADGGVQSERWVYAVGESPLVVTFAVATGRYPDATLEGFQPYAVAETLHRVGDGDHPCIYLDGQGCGNEGSGIDADDWYDAQPKDAEGIVADADVFTHLRDLHAAWSQP